MKQCHICNHSHNHVYCPICGAFSFTINGDKRAVNRLGISMFAALGKMSPVTRYARKLQNNVPVSVGSVRV